MTESDLLPGTYWHSTDRRPAGFLFNNFKAGSGLIESMSTIRARHGDRFVTLGDLVPWADRRAEAMWEVTRPEHHPDRPSRRGAFFLFESLAVAQSAWRPGLEPLALEAWILRSASVHRGDFNWLSAPEADWAQSAAAYWAGEPCERLDPAWEYVVDGCVFFPGWRDAPFCESDDRAAAADRESAESHRMVTCPICAVAFKAFAPNGTMFNSADRSRCVVDPHLPILNECPNVAPMVQAAWEELNASHRGAPL